MNDFKERARKFLEELGKLQKSFDLRMLPIITQYGPDIQLQDLIKEETKVESNEVETTRLKKVSE
jgi:hypothetical protein